MGVQGINNLSGIRVERIGEDPTQVLRDLAKVFLQMVFLGASQGQRNLGLPVSNNYQTNLTGALLQAGLLNGIGLPATQSPLIIVQRPALKLAPPSIDSLVSNSEKAENNSAASKQSTKSYVKNVARSLKRAQMKVKRADSNEPEKKAAAKKELAKAKIKAHILSSTKNEDGSFNPSRAKRVANSLISDLDKVQESNRELNEIKEKRKALEKEHEVYNSRSKIMKKLRSKPAALEKLDDQIADAEAEVAGAIHGINTTVKEEGLKGSDLQARVLEYLPNESKNLSYEIENAILGNLD